MCRNCIVSDVAIMQGVSRRTKNLYVFARSVEISLCNQPIFVAECIIITYLACSRF